MGTGVSRQNELNVFRIAALRPRVTGSEMLADARP